MTTPLVIPHLRQSCSPPHPTSLVEQLHLFRFMGRNVLHHCWGRITTLFLVWWGGCRLMGFWFLWMDSKPCVFTIKEKQAKMSAQLMKISFLISLFKWVELQELWGQVHQFWKSLQLRVKLFVHKETELGPSQQTTSEGKNVPHNDPLLVKSAVAFLISEASALGGKKTHSPTLTFWHEIWIRLFCAFENWLMEAFPYVQDIMAVRHILSNYFWSCPPTSSSFLCLHLHIMCFPHSELVCVGHPVL